MKQDLSECSAAELSCIVEKCDLNANDSLRESGFLKLEQLIDESECDGVIKSLPNVQRAGSRSLLYNQRLQSLAEEIRDKLAPGIPELTGMSALQCSLFLKSQASNWLVSWHQDRSLPANAEFIDKFGVKSRIKEGRDFIQPGSTVLQKVLAVRIHLDPNTMQNGPLRVLPGSHTLGVLSSTKIARLNKQSAATILGVRGSAVVMRPLLVHASSKSIHPAARRVLHFVYA